MHTLIGTSILIAALFALAQLVPLADAQIVTCKSCGNFIKRCGISQQCCNGNKTNYACTPNSQPCPPPVECGALQCGVDCNNNAFYCPLGQYCCKSCKGVNQCLPNGQVCVPECEDNCPTPPPPSP